MITSVNNVNSFLDDKHEIGISNIISQKVTDIKKLSMNCCFLNARGILNKMDELKIRIEENDWKIIAIAETWLTQSIDLAEIHVDGFKCYRKDRCCVKPGEGGGVLLYVKNDIVSSECTDINQIRSESVWCTVINKSGNAEELLVGVCYKSPSAG